MAEKTMQIQKNSKNLISSQKSTEKHIYQIDRYLIGDMKMDVLARLEPAHDKIIEKLKKMGIFKTKSEAIRAGIIALAEEYDLFGEIKPITDPRAIRKFRQINEAINAGKMEVYSEEEFRKKYSKK